MYNYRLLNAYGKPIGVISLESEDLPKLIMAGEKIILSGSYVDATQRFINFLVVPEPVTERT